MSDLSPFQITRRWAPDRPNAIQLYSFPRPNGVRASVALEELGLEHDPHIVTLSDEDVKSTEFLSLNPNDKIPAIIDPNGPNGQLVQPFESRAILIYLAEKTGRLLLEGVERYDAIKWLMFQMGGIGPMFGQMGYLVKFAGPEIDDRRPRDRYVAEAIWLLGVLEHALDGKEWIVDRFSIADIAIAPWRRAIDFYGAKVLVGWNGLKNAPDYLDRYLSRPAVQRGLRIRSHS